MIQSMKTSGKFEETEMVRQLRLQPLAFLTFTAVIGEGFY